MEWLTEHFDLILPVALVLLFLFQRMFVGEEEEEGRAPSDSKTAEEAKRIQEEIRRKIVARQQGRPDSGHGGEAEAQQPPAFEETRQSTTTFPRAQGEPVRRYDVERPQAAEPPRPPPVRRPEPAPGESGGQGDIQDQLRLQMERLRKARQAKEDAVKRTTGQSKKKRVEVAKGSSAMAGNLRGQLLADLATGESMKRAFLLKEVVDRPIGLRDRPDVFSNWS